MTIEMMVNGLPGKMAMEVAKYGTADPRDKSFSDDSDGDFNLIDYSLTGQEIAETKIWAGSPSYPINLIKPDERENTILKVKLMHPPSFISVDYSHPSAVNDNADFYCRHNLAFVMGTTGGDRIALEQRVKDSDNIAVIAPNMAKQIVGFQSMMQYAAQTLPNLFKDYSLEIVESHQKGKADTSGTAKAMVEYFNKLGIPFSVNQIKMIREPIVQKAMNIPDSALLGHGWHTYTLKSKDGSVLFSFTHNVNGRDIYAKGTLDAVRFLDKKVKAGEKGKVYSMIDVLKDN